MNTHKGEPLNTETVIDRTESQLPVKDRTLARTDPPGALAARPADDIPIGAILNHAIEKGTDPASIEKLVALYERVAALKAAQLFAQAMSAFKAACPPIPRGTVNTQFKVKKVDANGVLYECYRQYASLEDIERTIHGPMGEHGLSYRWGDSTIANNMLAVACIVSHIGGHSVSSVATMPVTSSAGCSEQQKYGAARTYARRDSLVDALGLTTCDEDDDGNEPPAPPPAVPITADQVANLQVLIDEVKPDVPKMLAYFGIERIEQLPAARFKEAIAGLEKRRKA